MAREAADPRVLAASARWAGGPSAGAHVLPAEWPLVDGGWRRVFLNGRPAGRLLAVSKPCVDAPTRLR